MSSLETKFQEYKKNLDSCIALLNWEDLDRVIYTIETARRNNRFIFLCGNGGSNSTASHFANDLRSLNLKPKYRTVCLNDSTSITCIGNDFGYEECFSRQLECLLYKDDVVLGISASGNSPNIVNALQYANDHEGIPISLVGFNGGHILTRSSTYPGSRLFPTWKNSICLHTKSPVRSYRVTEDVHMILTHFIIEILSQIK